MTERAQRDEASLDDRPAQRRGLIRGTVGQGGDNHAEDVAAVQTALLRHGCYSGSVSSQCAPDTTGAIRRFQRGFLHHPDALVEPGKITEQHLTSTTPVRSRRTEESEHEDDESDEIAPASRNASAQMSRLESVADNVASRRPHGGCYAAVKRHISNAGGYGNIRNIYTDRRFSSFQGYAKDFAHCVDQDPARFGLEKLSVSNPYDAPLGAIVVVAPGSPGTHHPTAGDITVRGPGDAFYNDGAMNYHGRAAWPPRHGGVLGVYRPKS
jgi:hypothetical protein